MFCLCNQNYCYCFEIQYYDYIRYTLEKKEKDKLESVEYNGVRI